MRDLQVQNKENNSSRSNGVSYSAKNFDIVNMTSEELIKVDVINADVLDVKCFNETSFSNRATSDQENETSSNINKSDNYIPEIAILNEEINSKTKKQSFCRCNAQTDVILITFFNI